MLSLEGEPQDVVLELDSDIISGKDGVDKIIARLNTVYEKDEPTQKCNAVEPFESIRVTDTKSEKQLALKLHCQFAHPSKEKLLQLITSAGPLCSNNKELIKEVKMSQDRVPHVKCTGNLHQDQ